MINVEASVNRNLITLIETDNFITLNQIQELFRGLYLRLIYMMREDLATKQDLSILIAIVTLRNKHTFLYSLTHFI